MYKYNRLILNMSNISSPCIKICSIDNEKCIGCGRSLEQIANWRNYSEDERLEIMRQIKEKGEEKD